MYRKIMVVVDRRRVTQSAIDQAIELARTHRTSLFFFSVLPQYGYPISDVVSFPEMSIEEFDAKSREDASELLAKAMAWAEQRGVYSYSAMGIGMNEAQCVAEAAAKRHCDLIVVGTEEQNAVVRLLSGSMVPGLITSAMVPVLVCREHPIRSKFNYRGPVTCSSIKLRQRELGSRGIGEAND
jgi:nucleotide-binding universal stress UspA family protein